MKNSSEEDDIGADYEDTAPHHGSDIFFNPEAWWVRFPDDDEEAEDSEREKRLFFMT